MNPTSARAPARSRGAAKLAQSTAHEEDGALEGATASNAVLDIRVGPVYLLLRMTLTPTTRGIHACPSDSSCIG